MSEKVTIYDTATGAVLSHHMLRPGQDWIRGEVELGTHYIDLETMQPVEKGEMPAQIEGNRVVGIPVGSTAIVNLERQPGTIDDGDLDMPSSPYPQTYSVTLQHPHFLPWEGEVEYDPG